MEYALTAGLTLALSWIIIKIIKRSQKLRLKRVLYSQSDMHNLLKRFFSTDIRGPHKRKSQMKQRMKKQSISVLIIDDKAYWVTDNIFYVADAINNDPIPESAKPVDTANMSQKDIDKMLFILDNLDMEDNDDSGSTRNK